MDKTHSLKCCRGGAHKPLRCHCWCTCDGYHTFDELYEHRIELYIALCRSLVGKLPAHTNGGIWRSKLHDDGSSFDGWFILGIRTDPSHQITYHLPMKYWRQCSFAYTFKKAPEWDKHTSDDVLKRLRKLPNSGI